MRSTFGLALGALLAAGCIGSDDDGGRACTAIFAMITIEVVDANGTGVSGLDARTVHVPSGELVHAQVANPSHFYVIADDSTTRVDRDGEPFRFSVGSGGQERATLDVELSTDGCHVQADGIPARLVVP